MSEEVEQSLVLRMAMRGRADPGAAVTPTRALRLALSRAAQRAAGLTITTLGVGDERLNLAETLSRLDGDWLCLRLDEAADAEAPPGLAAVDFDLISALIEMQTRGALAGAAGDPRPLTAADMALCEPFISGFLREMAAAEPGARLDGWDPPRRAGARIPDLRAAAQILPEGDLRVISFSLYLGQDDRQGQAVIALPLAAARAAPQDPARRAAQWAADLGEAVLGVETPVAAVLHRLRLPLEDLRSWEVGHQLALPGVRLTDVRLEGRDGRLIGRGRLGQSAGLRAVRIEAAPALALDDAPPPLAPAVAGPAAGALSAG